MQVYTTEYGMNEVVSLNTTYDSIGRATTMVNQAAQIVSADLTTYMGPIHVLNAVLFPPDGTLIDYDAIPSPTVRMIDC